MRCFRPPRWNHACWERAWNRCSQGSWAKRIWNVKSSPRQGSDVAGDKPVSSLDAVAVSEIPAERRFSFSVAFLTPLTNFLLAVSLCLVMGAWGGMVVHSLRSDWLISARLQESIPMGIPSQVVLDEGVKAFPWLSGYQLGGKNMVAGNETLLITSTSHATQEAALEEARQALSLHILKRHQQRYGRFGVLNLPREDLITYFPTHEGTLETSITVGKFTEPMYRVYLLATIPQSSLERLDATLRNTLRSRNGDLFLGSVLIIALSLISLVIAFRVDLATQGRRRWVGNLCASVFLLATGSATIAARFLM